MPRVLSLSGSPSPVSRTARLLRHLDARIAARGHEVIPLDVRELPPEALLGADLGHPELLRVAQLVASTDGIVVGTPVYKAAYSGLLKALLDVLPQYALGGKAVLPLATGGSTAHVLAVDYALRPVLAAMGAAHIGPGWFTRDTDIRTGADGGLLLLPDTERELGRVTDAFVDVLESRVPVAAR
jgi:FMN reductase